MGSYPRHTPEGAGSVTADQETPLSYRVEAEHGPVSLRYFAPPESLCAYFGSLYIFSVTSSGYADVTRADVPQLRFRLEGQGGNYIFQDGMVLSPPDVCLLGPTFGATRFELDQPARVLGTSLLPAGWVALYGDDASAMADSAFDMAACDADYGLLLQKLRSMEDADAMASLCWSFLGERIRPFADSTWRMLEAVDGWLMDEGSPRIETLVERTGLSARQLARLTNRYYGAPPKLLARKYRALRCSARIALDRESWQVLCEDGGFYDQSHFIREIKHFIGLTPQQLQNEPSAVAQLTLLRRSLGGDVAVINRMS
ncbi:helix-turn-helix domain-containing protein [Sphingobium baderi]|uniref:helix-turn-helix domain-containing protein n=1 Tax=Sphingobium baderi TaxID=1332080 RepID=UPI0003FC754D|nr:AraC family transcriptional regulator [Sphingobium baderi LL03]